MPQKLRDLTGKQIYRWTVIRYLGAKKWLCRCECGNESKVYGSCLWRGGSRSCGCLAAELSSKRNRRHGAKSSKLYRTWNSMKNRCLNTKDKDWPRYGGRGITVCDRWRESFEAFRDDMGEPPSAIHSIDRIDGSLGYSPGNCRWATATEQASNRRNNLFVSVGEATETASEWDRRMGYVRGTVARRIKRGWSDVDAVLTPVDMRFSIPQAR